MQDNNIYVKTYYRVNAGYKWGEGMEDEALNSFYAEVAEILTGIGFSVESARLRNSCPKVTRGAENLYCHPMNLSGYINKNEVEKITEALKAAETFKIRNVDIYEEAKNYTRVELSEELQNQKELITQKILGTFKTKRKNLFVPEYTLNNVKSDVPFFKHRELEKIESEFIYTLFKELETEGKLQSAKTRAGMGYRSIDPKPAKTRRKKLED